VRENQRRLRQQCSYYLSNQQLQLKHLTSTIQLMSPLRTLDRGYSLLRDDNGNIVSTVSSIEPGQALTATVSDGEFGVKVSPES
jgi:exodeoxyribonuclease VII large subunit